MSAFHLMKLQIKDYASQKGPVQIWADECMRMRGHMG